MQAPISGEHTPPAADGRGCLPDFADCCGPLGGTRVLVLLAFGGGPFGLGGIDGTGFLGRGGVERGGGADMIFDGSKGSSGLLRW